MIVKYLKKIRIENEKKQSKEMVNLGVALDSYLDMKFRCPIKIEFNIKIRFKIVDDYFYVDLQNKRKQ